MTHLFGTNGIRGIVNNDMTGDLALCVAQAWGTYLKRTLNRPHIAIGTDARLSNAMFNSAVTAGFVAAGCDVVDVGIVPTPTLQYIVREKRFDSGVMITASHNPPQFNGIKGIASDGTEFSKDVEDVIETIYFEKKATLADWKNVGNLSTWGGSIDLYLKRILSIVDAPRIKKRHFHIVCDYGNGVGALVAPVLLKKLGCTVTELHGELNGTFPGRNSEPLPENLEKLMKTVPDVNADFGVAFDGDADRAIFVDEHGTYLWGDTTLSLTGKYITRKRGGILVTPVTTSTCFEDTVKEYKGKVVYTQVGSPTVARVMMKTKAIFGGEENGGLIFPNFQYCRDASMSLATMLEICAKEQRTLSELIAEIPQYTVYKMKIACPHDKKEAVLKTILTRVKEHANVVSIDETDGVKLYVHEGWVLVRPSGTEPIVRIYAESKKKTDAQKLAFTYAKLAEDIIRGL